MRPTGGKRYHQGFFKPRNPDKYVGNPNEIVFRSSWELAAMTQFDANPNILAWSSETVVVPYFDPVKGRARRYFPDFVIKYKDKDNKVQVMMIEVKPEKEMSPPVKGKTKKAEKRFIAESATFATNTAKWKSAQKFCQDKGWQFKVVNERDLKIKV